MSGDWVFESFPAYPVRGEEIVAAADEASSAAYVLELLGDDVEREHRPVVGAVEGEIRPQVEEGGEPARQTSLRVRQVTQFAAGGLRMFGYAVMDFNALSGPAYNVEGTRADPRSAEKLDRFWFEQAIDGRYDPQTGQLREGGLSSDERDALFARLLDEYRWLEAKLDDAASEVRAMLNRGPNEDDVRTMYASGALPAYLSVVFPGYDLDGVAFTRVPADLRHKSPDQLEEYLRNHPNARDYVTALIRQGGGLSDQEQAVIEAQARVDAQLVRDAVESGDTSQHTLDQISAGQELLALLNEQTAQNERLSEAAHTYTFAWTNAMGAAALAALPQTVSDAVHANWNAATAPSDTTVQPTIDSYLSTVGDAILNLTKPDYQTTDGPDTTYAFDLNHDGSLDTTDLPQAIRDLVDTRIGEFNGISSRAGSIDEYGQPTMDTITNLDTLNGWSDLLAASTVDPGRDFATDLAEQAIQAKQDANAILANATNTADRDYFLTDDELAQLELDLNDTAASQLLDVAARNQAAAADLLIDDTHRQELLGLNWNNGDGAAHIITAGTDRDPTDHAGGTDLQAQAALAVMTEIAADPQEYLDRTTNETISDAIVNTGITWIDTFGENVDTNTNSKWNHHDTDILGRHLPHTITLSDNDQENFLEYIAGTGNNDAIRFQTVSDLYAQQLISGALDQDDPHALEEALEWAGHADGQLRQATLEWAMHELGEEHDRQRAELLAENRSNAAASTAAQITASLAGPWLPGYGGTVNEVVEPIFDGIWEQQDIPDYESMEDDEIGRRLEAAALDADTRRNYLLAQVEMANSQNDDPDLQPLFNDVGSLKKPEEIANINTPVNGLDQLERLAESSFRDWNARQPQGNEVSIAEFDAARDGTFAPVHANDNPPDAGWRNDRTAEDLLYGDNFPDELFEGPWEMYPVDPDQIGRTPTTN